MKKYLSLILMSIMLISCSKKIKVTGNIKNANPLERIEIVEASGVATLPLINIPVDSKGNFSSEFSAPKNGMYVIAYQGNISLVYLKGGQNLNISGDAMSFPSEFTITGDAKANNDFIKQADISFQKYAAKINVEQMIGKKEEDFIKDFQKIHSNLVNSVKENAEKYKADSDVLEYKTLDTNVKLVALLNLYEKSHAMISGDIKYKPSAKFLEVKKDITKDNDKLVAEFPMYREYLLTNLKSEFDVFVQNKMKNTKETPLVSEIFAEFIKAKKEISSITQDYLLAYTISQADINYQNYKNYDKISKIIDENIKDKDIKTNLKELQKVLMGYKTGSLVELPITKTDGGTTNIKNLKGKPTLVFFYASYSPNISLHTIPILKEINELYKSKLNFAFVNMDDTQEQFKKTSAAMFNGFSGENYFVEGGINAKTAKDFGLYAFKVPSVLLLDKDGKSVNRPFFSLDDPELLAEIEKLTALKR